MNKKIIIAIVLLLLFSGAAFGIFTSQFGSSGKATIDYVPDETPYFSGSLQPQRLSRTIELLEAFGYSPEYLRASASLLSDFESESPNLNMLMLVSERLSLGLAWLMENRTLASAVNADYALYEAAGFPVLRMKLPPLHGIWAAIDDMQAQSGASPTEHDEYGAYFRRYEFNSDSALIVAETEGYLVLTLDVPGHSSLAVQLGAELPSASLNSTARLANIVEQHGYLPHDIAYIDIAKLAKILTGAQEHVLTGMIKDFMSKGGSPSLSAACEKEVRNAASAWPMLLSGYTSITDDRIIGNMKFSASENNLVLSLLQKIQGHISPNVYDAGSAFAMGVGVNVDKLVPAIQAFTQQVAELTFECEQFVEAQQQLTAFNPAQLSVGAAMLGGVQGFGISLDSLDGLLDASSNPQQIQMQEMMDKLSGRVVLSAPKTNRANLINIYSSFVPGLEQLATADDGILVEINSIPQLTMAAKNMGGDLVVAAGGNASAALTDVVMNEELSANGLLMYYIDGEKYSELMAVSLKASAQSGEATDQEAQKVIDLFTSLTMPKMLFTASVTDQALQFEYEAYPSK